MTEWLNNNINFESSCHVSHTKKPSGNFIEVSFNLYINLRMVYFDNIEFPNSLAKYIPSFSYILNLSQMFCASLPRFSLRHFMGLMLLVFPLVKVFQYQKYSPIPEVFSNTRSILQYQNSKASILHCSAFYIVQLSHPYMTTGKSTAWLDGRLLAK